MVFDAKDLALKRSVDSSRDLRCSSSTLLVVEWTAAGAILVSVIERKDEALLSSFEDSGSGTAWSFWLNLSSRVTRRDALCLVAASIDLAGELRCCREVTRSCL